jgi:hypothetical protein
MYHPRSARFDDDQYPLENFWIDLRKCPAKFFMPLKDRHFIGQPQHDSPGMVTQRIPKDVSETDSCCHDDGAYGLRVCEHTCVALATQSDIAYIVGNETEPTEHLRGRSGHIFINEEACHLCSRPHFLGCEDVRGVRKR